MQKNTWNTGRGFTLFGAVSLNLLRPFFVGFKALDAQSSWNSPNMPVVQQWRITTVDVSEQCQEGFRSCFAIFFCSGLWSPPNPVDGYDIMVLGCAGDLWQVQLSRVHARGLCCRHLPQQVSASCELLTVMSGLDMLTLDCFAWCRASSR